GATVNCPRCGKTTISFSKWCRSPNAFRWTCPHCYASLKASRETWAWFVLMLALAISILGMIIWLEQIGTLPAGKSRVILSVALLAFLVPSGWVAYRNGGYVES